MTPDREKCAHDPIGQETRVSFSQLNPFLPVSVEDNGVAFADIDNGEEHNLA